MKIKTPPMPEADGLWKWTNKHTGTHGIYEDDPRKFGIDMIHPDYEWTRLPSQDQLAARDAQWLALVGPVVEALSVVLNNNASLVFEREARAAISAITEGEQG